MTRENNKHVAMPEITAVAESNYQLALCDTLSLRSMTAIRAISQKNRNPALVSELSRGLGDTAVSGLIDSEGATASSSLVAADPDALLIGASIASLPEQGSTEAELPVVEQDSQDRCAENAQESAQIAPVCSALAPSPNNRVLLEEKKTVAHVPPVPYEPDGAHRIRKLRKIASPPSAPSSEILAPARPATIQDAETLSLDTADGSLDVCRRDGREIVREEDSTADQTVQIDTPSTEISIGAVLADRYLIMSKISEGGYGVVYKARQIGIDRIVAIKRLKTRHEPADTKRFLREANIVKNLLHPNTIQIFDAGFDKNHAFIAMEYIDGISLADLVRSERLSIMRVINIAKQILKSLNEAHENGIVHRDVKPSNIMIRQIIGERDFVKVLDFGIAKSMMQGGPQLTRHGTILGTPQYLAPELFFGDAPTPAVDVFATGLIIAELLSGMPVMPYAAADVMAIATSTLPIPIPQNVLASELGNVVQRALCKDPAGRYQNAGEMLADILEVELRFKYSQSCIDPQALDLQEQKNNNKIYIIAIAAMLFIIANLFVLFHILS